eukprot:610033-Pyramimonas_sp.AAC.1
MATVRRSRTGSMKEARLMPPATRSMPSCRWEGPTASARSRAARRAASFRSPCGGGDRSREGRENIPVGGTDH